MIYKKAILILLLLSKASSSHFYASAPQKYTREKNSKSNSKNKVAISWNGINYCLFNNLYYFSTSKYTFGDPRFSPSVYIEYRHTSPSPLILEEEKRFFPRIQEFLYNLLSFSLYFFKKSFFYKIDILGTDIFFYPMTADYTTNILSFILGTTACKISLQDDIKLECRFGIGLSWRRLSYSYAVSYKCKNCNPDRITVDYPTDIDNKLLYDIKMTEKSNGVEVAKSMRYIESGCKHTLNFSILKHLKDPYTWEHLDIIINCSIFNLLLFNIVSMSLNFNFGIREIYQACKYTKLHNKKHEENQILVGEKINLPLFMLRSLFSIRHFSLRILFFIPKRGKKK